MERDVINRAVPKIKCISTHTLTWSVTDVGAAIIYAVQNFNSHAHVERDVFEHLILTANYISTHTLTWSVTYLINEHSFEEIISTHTLTWSVTLNPGRYKKSNNISTHTLTWSVTIIFSTTGTTTEFQLTRSRGA